MKYHFRLKGGKTARKTSWHKTFRFLAQCDYKLQNIEAKIIPLHQPFIIRRK